MRSRAHFKTHPIHPILVSFPIAFFTGTLVFDVLSVVLQKEMMATAALYLNVAGLIGGLIAAVPGFIDYLHTVPPKSSASSRAVKHALTNITMMAVFGVALIYRQTPDHSWLWLIVMDVAGFTLLMIAGWIGGTLVYRNQIGVDIRYANAGKWKEETVDHAETEVAIADENELTLNQMKLVHYGNDRIVLARKAEGYVAFDDRCPHRGGSLAGGSMMCGTVQCPWHGSQFDVSNGALKAGPAETGIKTYNTTIKEGKVWIINKSEGKE